MFKNECIMGWFNVVRNCETVMPKCFETATNKYNKYEPSRRYHYIMRTDHLVPFQLNSKFGNFIQKY